ncbi:cyclic nucleotide-binding protein [Chitinophaga caeni]|uniref:Cyclic nucleotide-binding protein n=1 Tax=Chitinophaga caeni TaxID=2029983 RepID=A0A291QSB9_9BACT|nr:Crp/Fnr family transcriptional regulator [Chitinophaga caeni]ATL46734.1 cyclic nucleotide-binding protein [Chitinophaga caeni]
MSLAFHTYLRSHMSLGEQDLERISMLAIPKTLQRNEMLLQQGQICRYKTFVVKGLMRIFGTLENGTERILQFSPENTWTLDPESYDHQTPASFSIAAIEQSELLLWTKPDFEILLNEIPALKSFSLKLLSHSSYSSRHRLFSSLSGSPEEKYNDFLQHYPDILNRIPLHMIAAYLGISLKTLTRIRHAQLHR